MSRRVKIRVKSIVNIFIVGKSLHYSWHNRAAQTEANQLHFVSVVVSAADRCETYLLLVSLA